MRLTRKDFEAIAAYLKQARQDVCDTELDVLFAELPAHASLMMKLELWAMDVLAHALAGVFDAQVPRFNRHKFFEAASVEAEPATYKIEQAISAAKREAQGQAEAAPADIPISGPVGNRLPAVPDRLFVSSTTANSRHLGEDAQQMLERMRTAFTREELNALFPTYPFPATQLVDVGDLADTSRTTLPRYRSPDPNEGRLAELDEAMRPPRVDPF